ncbi:MAG: CBS domain-containing protein [Haloarculaceae archaeon]
MDGDVPVREVMDGEYVGVSESDTVRETAELLLSEGVGSVVVLRGSDPVGLVTRGDALGAFVSDEGGAEVSNVMRSTVPTVSPGTTLGEAADELAAMDTGHLVVTDGSEPVGVLTEHDLVAASPFAPGRDPVEPATAAVGRSDDPDVEYGEEFDEDYDGQLEGSGAAGRPFEDQSICEGCGSLARDLSTFNGQLLCADCRDI